MEINFEVFVAGCVGCLILQLYFVVPDTTSPVQLKGRAKMTVLIVQALLAGYVAACVFEAARPVHAFLIGIGFDGILVSCRRVGLQVSRQFASDKQTLSGESDA